MHYREFAAPAPLSRLVHSVWLLKGSAGRAPQAIVPDGRLELVLHLGEPFSRLSADGTAVPQNDFLVSGQLTRPLTLIPPGDADVVGIRLDPLGAHALLRIPLDQITDQVISISDVDRRLRTFLLPAMRAKGPAEERAHMIFDALGRRLAEGPCPRMARAFELLGRTDPIGVRALAREVGVPERTLQRKFSAEAGLGAKEYQRVIRFRRAFALISAAAAGRLAAVALRAGYYDQAHLNRDFRRFAGASPRAFLRSNPALAEAFARSERG